ncbi:MAG: autotransporter domain-containing protein [Rhodospirillales bacterium]|nr:autotransporter domain-containing protein [Rhodospirillales bacterium]
MNTATWKTRFYSFLAVGLLGLAVVFANAVPASAQTESECPLSPGLTPPENPRVTAEDVTDRGASLMDFALAVRERSVEHAQQATTVEEGLYIGCAIRQDNGIWRSGDTYIVTLTLDGRVFIHAKDMSLSGGLLNPVIYGQILSALGVSQADLFNLASPDPAVAGSAYQAVVATLSQEPDASFDATAPIPGLSPGIPGASGYAAVYVSRELRSPIVLLAGFDLDESHLASETIEHVTPATRAEDVMDRETLKAFVTEAGNYFLEVQRAGDLTAASKLKIALRDPTGPWRHGSVYLYVLNLTDPDADPPQGTILFHGAFPDRFENRPLVPTVKDVRTGQYILPQVIAAARGSVDGGFVDYYFDDPADHTDSADIPKVGYAREFKGQIQTPDGRTIPVDIIVGSGFYGSASQEVAEGGNAVIEAVLPQVMRAMTASTVDAVSSRIERATSDIAPDAAFSFGGASTLSDALLANGHALGDGTLDFSRLLANSSFTMTLNAADNGGSGLFGDLTFWGSGDYRSISGGNPQSVDYDGSVTSANLGIDTRLGADMLAGLAVSQARGTVDYMASSASGELTTSLTSVNPYVGWQMAGGMNLWAVAGFGSGEVELDDQAADAQSSDLTQRMIAAGVSGPLMSSDEMIAGGTTNLNLKGEVAFTSADIDGSGTLESMSLSASRQRLMLEGEHVQKLDAGATFTPSLELGLRNDGGDGETGTGIEAGGALRYADAASGLTVEGRVRTLLSHSGDYEETGVSGLVRIAPGSSGQGLALVVQPAWGQTGSGVNRLWENGVTAGVSPDNQARLNTEIGYGLGVAPGMGVVTPYAGLGLAGEGAQWWRMGARWQLAPAASVSVEGSLYEAAIDDGPGRGLMLRGALRW